MNFSNCCKYFLLLLLCYCPVSLFAAHIRIAQLSQNSVCAGSGIRVQFLTDTSQYRPGNVFSVVVSDTAGQFDSLRSPLLHGITTYGDTLSISVIIPDSLLESSNYLLRVVADSPFTRGDSAQFTINQRPHILLGAHTDTVCSGAYNLSASNGGDTATRFVWAPGTFLSDTTGDTIMVNQTVTSFTAVVYTVIATDSNGCVSSDTLALMTKPAAQLPMLLAGVRDSMCVNDTIMLSAMGNTAGSYAWSSSDSAISTLAVTGDTSATVSGLVQGGADIILSFSNGCGTPAIDTYNVRIKPLPVVAPISGPTRVCGNGATISSISLTNGTTGGVWGSTNGYSGSINATGVVTALYPGLDTFLYTVTISGCSTMVNHVVITDTVPVIDTTAYTICSGGTTTLPITNIPSNFTWTVSSTESGGNTGFTQNPTTPAFIGDTLINPSFTNPNTIVYAITPISLAHGCVAAAAQRISYTVNPAPGVAGIRTSYGICSGNPLSAPLSAAIETSFGWTQHLPGGIAGGGATGSGSRIIDTLTNSTYAPDTAVYTVIGTSNFGCNSAPIDIRVVVYPVPTMNIPDSFSVCSNGSVYVPLNTNGYISATFAWSPVIVSSTGLRFNASEGVGAALTDTLIIPFNTHEDSLRYSVVPTSVLGNCVGPAYSLKGVVFPLPKLYNTVVSDRVCSNTNKLDTLRATATSLFNWTAFTPNGVIGAAGGFSDTVINLFLEDTSHTFAGTVIYSVTPYLLSTSAFVPTCRGRDTTIFVTVNPKPVFNNPSLDSIFYICDSTTTHVLLSTTTAISRYIFSITDTSHIGYASAGYTTSVIAQTLKNKDNYRENQISYITTAVSDQGCLSDPKTITVNVSPRIILTSPNPKTDSTCNNTEVKITLESSAQTGTVKYFWDKTNASATYGGGAFKDSTGTRTSIIQRVYDSSNALDASFDYFITPIYVNVHNDYCYGTVDTVHVTIFPTPVISNTTAPTICSNSFLYYTPTYSVGNSRMNDSVSISLPGDDTVTIKLSSIGLLGQITDIVSSNNILIPVVRSYDYSFSTLNGCPGHSRVSFTICPTPPAPMITVAETNLVCRKSNFVHFEDSSLADSRIRYAWSSNYPGDRLDIDTLNYLNLSFADLPGDRWVKIQARIITNSLICVNSDSVKVAVRNVEAPQILDVFYDTVGMVMACEYNGVSLDSTYTNGYSYRWGRINRATYEYNDLPGVNNYQYYLFDDLNNKINMSQYRYLVKIIDSATHCQQKVYDTTLRTSFRFSQGGNGKTVEMTVYPNPVQDLLHVVVNDVNLKNLTFEIYDEAGRRMLSAPSQAPLSGINTETLPPGVYRIVCFSNGSKLATQTFTKTR